MSLSASRSASASFHRRALGARAIQKLGGDEARYEKRDEHHPVERIAKQQRVIGRKEEPVEYEECHDRDRHAEDTATGCAGREDDEEKNQRDVSLVEILSESEQDRSRGHEAGKGQAPRQGPGASPIAGDYGHDRIEFVMALITRSKPIPDSRLGEDVAGT